MERPVLVLDFGSQYVQLIARRVRERHAFARVVRHDVTLERVRELDPLAIILSGGPASVYAPNAPKCDPRLFHLDVPILGVCYGMQLVCEAMGGLVKPNPSREFGRAEYDQWIAQSPHVSGSCRASRDSLMQREDFREPVHNALRIRWKRKKRERRRKIWSRRSRFMLLWRRATRPPCQAFSRRIG